MRGATVAALLAGVAILGALVGSHQTPCRVRDVTALTRESRSFDKFARYDAVRPASPAIEKRGRLVRGRVIASNGNSISSASVCVWYGPDETLCEFTKAGAFTLEVAERGAKIFATAPGYRSCTLSLDDSSGFEEVQIRLDAADTLAVSGSVFDAGGGPVRGATVFAYGDTLDDPLALAYSDASGDFALWVPNRIVSLVARAEAYAAVAAEVQPPSASVRLQMAPESIISGEVIEGVRGQALAGIAVIATPEEQDTDLSHVTESRSDGSFRLSGLADGNYLIKAASQEFGSEPIRVRLAVGAVVEGLRLIASPLTALSGQVTLESRSCTSGLVKISGYSNASEAIIDGSYAFSGLVPGPYEVSVSCRGATTHREWIEIGRAPVSRSWDLLEGVTIDGKVLGIMPDGRIGVSVELTVIGEPTVGMLGVTNCDIDKAGAFRCSGLARGTYECGVVEAGQRQSERAIVDANNGAVSNVVLNMLATGTIHVGLTNWQPKQPKPRVFALGPDSRTVEAIHDNGLVTFPSLLLGTYKLYSSAAPEEAFATVELNQRGQVVELGLDADALKNITGRVLDTNGDPIADTWVSASVSSNPSIPSDGRALTDAWGNFAIEGLANTVYHLHAVGPVGGASIGPVSAGTDNVDVHVHEFGTLYGSVTASDGTLASTFSVVLLGERGVFKKFLGRQGAWSFPSLEPGRYQVIASSGDRMAVSNTDVRPGEGAELRLTLKATVDPNSTRARSVAGVTW